MEEGWGGGHHCTDIELLAFCREEGGGGEGEEEEGRGKRRREEGGREVDITACIDVSCWPSV